MRRVRIKSYRCLGDVAVNFNNVTTFIGPNGVGKSSILHALDWFFNGTPLIEDDLASGSTDRIITVEVEFDSITDNDRHRLGKYAIPGSDVVTIWKRWDDGNEKLYGKGRALPDFSEIRNGANATERRNIYKEFRKNRPEFDLPSDTSDAQNLAALELWESQYPNDLEDVDIDSTTHIFGFAGQAMMSGLFDYVLVTADLRASEETKDVRSAILGRILEQAIDRSGAEVDLAELFGRMQDEQSDIHKQHFEQQLERLSQEMTDAVSALSSGREVRVSAQDLTVKPQPPQFKVSVLDADVETRVDRQGHGFQRALLISALRVLAEHGRGQGELGTICLAIEEPELFQHPPQARNFAGVMRNLASSAEQGVQIAYATHSPYFIEPRSFHQIRRVSREGGGSQGSVRVDESAIERVAERLSTFISKDSVERQLDSVCTDALAEALFAEKVLLVEGTTDSCFFNGAAERSRSLLLDGVFVADCGGKSCMLLPYAILDELGIPALVVVDSDRHLLDKLDRAKEAGDEKQVEHLESAIADTIAWNRRLLRFFGVQETDWPGGDFGTNLTFCDPTLEIIVGEGWPQWVEMHDKLIKQGLGFGKKHSWTYHAASIRAEGDVCDFVDAVLEKARRL
ncbi:MAG: ATP-dependent endonuclease [Actinomycetia bacterium]|nr:ATP-dependent endonuclease [Actinomycetes bacterium]